MSAVCRFIHVEKATYPVTLLCKVLKTARSTYYAWRAGRERREERRRADTALANEITAVHLASRKNYGVPRITAALRRHGRVAGSSTASGWSGSCGSTASPGRPDAPGAVA